MSHNDKLLYPLISFASQVLCCLLAWGPMPMGQALCTRLDNSSGSQHASFWPHGTTFCCSRLSIRQVLLQYHRCSADRPQPNADMGPILSSPLNCLFSKSLPQRSLFSGAAPLAKPVKIIRQWRKSPCERIVLSCSDASKSVHPSRRSFWRPACHFFGLRATFGSARPPLRQVQLHDHRPTCCIRFEGCKAWRLG
jgi:hypothetical protein